MAGNAGSRGKGFEEALSAAGMSEEVRSALSGAFEAMFDYRSEVANVAERNGNKVFDKMGTAAKAMGWPPELVDMTRQQMTQASKMQLQMMDQVMDAWEQMVKNPGAALKGAPSGAAFQFGQFGAMPGMQNFPGMDMSSMPTAPLQFWMQAAEMWQKSWQQALSTWMEAQSNMMGGNDKGRGSR